MATTAIFAQEKKYQGLLWEISGNGLQKKSYLYGSMHVSDKVSYHLSDAFFKHLLEADIVANESEPSTWLDVMGLMGNMGGYGNNYGYNKLYAQFYLTPSSKDDLYPLFRTNNFTLNNLLFRTNEREKEYQEETYLDMFIYRSGRKYNKKTVGLEDTKQSLLNMMDLDYDAMKPKEENIIAMQRILKNTNYQEALVNYYREKDLDMLDSLTTLASGEAYLKALLYDRNEVFVKSIDSLVKTGSLFAAVGAAHLPGKKGLIELLRAKGYTVKPVHGTYTDKGREKKEIIEHYFRKPDFETYTSADGIISLPVFKNAIIEDGANIQSPDLINGGYINVKRLLLNDFLKKDNKTFNHKTLDSLFYENIPGKITDKKFYTKNGYDIYDIKNITTTKNIQHYRYYISPLEIIMVSMVGEHDYVTQFDDLVFNNIQLKEISADWQGITTNKGIFSATMPAYTVVYGEKNKATVPQDLDIYSYDNNDKANYFILERTVVDDEDLEDTEFELRRMQYEFYRQLDADSIDTKLYSGKPQSFTSSSSIGEKTLQLKSVIKGAKYYLLGAVNASQDKTERFFNSFELSSPVSNQEYKIFTDSTAYYSIKVPKKQNEHLDFQPKNFNAGYDYGDKKNIFKEKYSSQTFLLPTGESIGLFYHQYHRYHTVQSVDSVWNKFTRIITETYNPNDADRFAKAKYDSPYNLWDKLVGSEPAQIKIKDEKKTYNNEADYYTFEGIAVADNSTQALKFKAVYRNGETYMVNTLIDKNEEKDSIRENIFNSFSLLKYTGEVLPEDRISLFIQDAGSEHDSIRNTALSSVNELVVTKSDIKKVEDFITTFKFKKDETQALIKLYGVLGETQEEAVLPFFKKQYKRADTNTLIQFALLEALTEVATDEAYSTIAELLDYDLPITDTEYKIKSLFNTFSDDTEHSAVLFPDILQYYSIPEYQEPIVNFIANLLENDAIKPKKLKAYKKMLLTNTKLEIKRTKSRLARKESDTNGYYRGNTNGNLPDYMQLLYPFRNQKDVKAVVESIKALDIENTKLAKAALDIKGGNINEAEIDSLIKNPETLFKIQHLLTQHKKTALLNGVTDEQFAASALINLGNLNPEKDSLIYMSKKVVPLNNRQISIFFYKISDIEEKDNNYNYSYSPPTNKLTAIAFVNKDGRINPMAYKYVGSRNILDDSELDEKKEGIIDALLNGSRLRATLGKLNPDSYDELDIDDYGY